MAHFFISSIPDPDTNKRVREKILKTLPLNNKHSVEFTTYTTWSRCYCITTQCFFEVQWGDFLKVR